jgi:exosortase A-associated hydrolase 2
MERGRRFCVLYEPADTAASLGAIVYIHPFAEEMNKSRRMAALQAQALADAGWTVLQVDLFGCGDSEGEFGDANWQQWQADVKYAAVWLRERTGCEPSLWGLRAGCLLACEAARDMKPATSLLLWQPVVSGRQSLQQFLRLKVASQLFGEPKLDRIGTRQLMDQLAHGEAVEIAGYALSPGLALGLDAAELTLPAAPARVAWLEVVPHTPAELSPAAHNRIASWQAAGHRVASHAVAGAAFWQTQEIAECPELVRATLALVAAWQP